MFWIIIFSQTWLIIILFFYVIKVGNKKLKKLSIHLLTAWFLKKN